jgi:predicted nucleotidyltransferase
MIFRNFAERLLGSKVKVKILMYMLSEGAPTSEREISRIIDVSHMAVNKSMKEFHELNLITPLKIGNVISWKFNEKSYAYEMIRDGLRKIAANPPLNDLKRMFTESLSGKNLKMAKIFGSIAEGKEEPDSDIGLIVVTENEEKKREIGRIIGKLSDTCAQRYGNILSPYIITEREAKNPANAKLIKSAEKGIWVIR